MWDARGRWRREDLRSWREQGIHPPQPARYGARLLVHAGAAAGGSHAVDGGEGRAARAASHPVVGQLPVVPRGQRRGRAARAVRQLEELCRRPGRGVEGDVLPDGGLLRHVPPRPREAAQAAHLRVRQADRGRARRRVDLAEQGRPRVGHGDEAVRDGAAGAAAAGRGVHHPRAGPDAGSRFEYKRGDDMLNFPGRQALQREGVTVKFLPYTQGVSASKMRRMWGRNMQVRGAVRPAVEAAPRRPAAGPSPGYRAPWPAP